MTTASGVIPSREGRVWILMLSHSASLLALAAACFCWVSVSATAVEWDHQFPRDGAVVLLDSQNFDQALVLFPLLLVEFEAPWCGYCRLVQPEFQAAAKELAAVSPPVVLAKVNGITERKLTDRFDIHGYPSFRFFVDGRDQEYTGGRSSAAIISWTMKKASMSSVELKSIKEVMEFLQNSTSSLRVIGYLDSATEDAAEGFRHAARFATDAEFGHTLLPDVAEHLNLTRVGTAVLVKPNESGGRLVYDKDLSDTDQFIAFVNAHRRSRLLNFTMEIAAEVFQKTQPVLILICDGSSKGVEAERQFHGMADEMEMKVTMVKSGIHLPVEQRLLHYLGISLETARAAPHLYIVWRINNHVKRFSHSGEIDGDSIRRFVDDVLSGQHPVHYRTQPKPVSESGAVRNLVGSTFSDVVYNQKKNVLVQFYAPWCGHCVKMEPVYEKVAEIMANVPSVVIARADATSNDFEDITVNDFPTILLFPVGDPRHPIEYEGEREVTPMLDFLKRHISQYRDEL